MPSKLALMIAAVLTCAPVWAQSWRDAYVQGDYTRALSILHPLVFESEPVTHSADPFAALFLAAMYENGQAGERDLMFACSLAERAFMEASLRYHGGLIVKGFEAARDQVCSAITFEERAEAIELVGCPKLGWSRHHFELAPGHNVFLARRGIYVHQDNDYEMHQVPFGCAQYLAAARHVKLARPEHGIGSAERHVLELLIWTAGRTDDGTPQRALVWQAMEIAGVRIGAVAIEQVIVEPRSLFPLPGVPAGIAPRFVVRVDGEITYTLRTPDGTEKKGSLVKVE